MLNAAEHGVPLYDLFPCVFVCVFFVLLWAYCTCAEKNVTLVFFSMTLCVVYVIVLFFAFLTGIMVQYEPESVKYE